MGNNIDSINMSCECIANKVTYNIINRLFLRFNTYTESGVALEYLYTERLSYIIRYDRGQNEMSLIIFFCLFFKFCLN